MKKFGTLLFFLLLTLTSCKNKNQKEYKPASVGALNTVAIVIENDLWEGRVGDKIREYFAAPIPGLTWDEARFTIEQMPQKVFTGTTRYRRSVLFVSLDTVNVAHVKTDLYATPQKVAVIKGMTGEEIIENLDQHAEEFVREIRKMELAETQSRLLRSLSKDKILSEKFGITINLPSIYKVGKQEENFVWIDREIPKGTLNMIVYAIPWNSLSNDSTFTRDVVRLRDSIGQEYIPGPDIPNKVTYMVTEKAFAPYVFPATIAGRNAAEVRGVWEMENYAMAGPFLMYIIDDQTNNRKLVIEGFTFAPATNKRDYMFELEAIIKTLKFNPE